MQQDDLSKSLVAFEQDSTLVAVIELSAKTWLTAGLVPGLARDPLKKQAADPVLLLRLLHRWRDEAVKAGKTIERIAVAFEAGRDGFWLARWLRAEGIEAHVIHPTSIPVSREHRRAKVGPHRHAAADAIVPGLAARRAEALQHGSDPQHCRRGRAACQPRAA